MNILIERKIYTSKSTLSDMFVDGKHFGYILEPTAMCDTKGFCKLIPKGTYGLGYHNSIKFERVMPEILNVPGRTDILIHWGNDAVKNSVGCSLIGTNYGEDYISESKKKFEELDYILEHMTLKGVVITYA